MKYYSILLLSFLIISCGDDQNHGYGWEYDYKYQGMRVRGESQLTPQEIYSIYEKAVQCMGEKPPPFIIFTNEIHSDDRIVNRRGTTKTNPPLILIKDEEAIPHEMVHYFGVHGHEQDFKSSLQCIKQQDKTH